MSKLTGKTPEEASKNPMPSTSGNGPVKATAWEKLSNAYQRHGLKLGAQIIKEYAEKAAQITASAAMDQEQATFVKDFIATIAQMETDKLNPPDELQRELTSLPEVGKDTIKLHELVVKPEVFDGERPRPRRWLQEYNEAIIANGWSSKLAIKYFPTFLSKSAKDWYWTEIRPFMDETVKWVDVADQFSKNYLGEADYEQLSQAVDNTRQRPNESVSNFIPRFRRLLLLLSPSLAEEEQLRQIRTRLRPEYKALLSLVDPKTLPQLKKTCLKIEAGFAQKTIPTNVQHNAKPDRKRRPQTYKEWNQDSM